MFVDAIYEEFSPLFEKAVRLMEYAPRLMHKSDYNKHIEINTLSLLDYSVR